jgi:hypothetical protein
MLCSDRRRETVTQKSTLSESLEGIILIRLTACRRRPVSHGNHPPKKTLTVRMRAITAVIDGYGADASGTPSLKTTRQHRNSNRLLFRVKSSRL